MLIVVIRSSSLVMIRYLLSTYYVPDVTLSRH